MVVADLLSERRRGRGEDQCDVDDAKPSAVVLRKLRDSGLTQRSLEVGGAAASRHVLQRPDRRLQLVPILTLHRRIVYVRLYSPLI